MRLVSSPAAAARFVSREGRAAGGVAVGLRASLWIGDWRVRDTHEPDDTGVDSCNQNESQASSRVVDQVENVIRQIGRLRRLDRKFAAPTAERYALLDDKPPRDVLVSESAVNGVNPPRKLNSLHSGPLEKIA